MGDAAQRPGNNWDGHLPSCKMERAIMNAVEGIEDEDGRTNGLLKQDDEEMTVFRQRRTNTGPKGVLEDYKRDKAMKALMAQVNAVRQKELLKKQANATCRPAGESSEEDEEDEDDEEFRRYKLDRLREMQKQAHTSAGMPTFGMVETIEAFDMPSAIDNVGSEQSYVVVHLQEEYLATSVRVTCRLEELAKKFDQVRFLNVSASEAKKDLDPAELPILIAYQRGEYLGSVNKVGKAKGDSLTTAHVEEELLKLGVRPTASSAMKAAEVAALRRLQELDLGAGGAIAADRRAADEDEDEDEDDDEDDDDISDDEGRGRRGKGVRVMSIR